MAQVFSPETNIPSTARITRRHPSNDLMTVRELAQRTGMSEPTLYRLANLGQTPIPAIRFGSRLYFSRREYDRLVGSSVDQDSDD